MANLGFYLRHLFEKEGVAVEKTAQVFAVVSRFTDGSFDTAFACSANPVPSGAHSDDAGTKPVPPAGQTGFH